MNSHNPDQLHLFILSKPPYRAALKKLKAKPIVSRPIIHPGQVYI